MSTGTLFTHSAAAAAPIPGMPFPSEIPLTEILRQGHEVEITPSLAARIMSDCRCEYHLPPARLKVDTIVGEIKAGNLSRRATQLWFALLDGTLILIGGWARLAAVARSGVTVRFLIHMVPVESQDEVRALALRETQRSALGAEPGVIPPSAERSSTASLPAIPLAVSAVEHPPLVQILQHGREVDITPALANRILKESCYEHQRNLRPWLIEKHANEMRLNRFVAGVQITFGLLDGKLIGVNLYHRMNAVVKSGKTVRFMVQVVPCANASQLNDLYSIFDEPASGRKLMETAGAILEDAELGSHSTAALLRAVQVIEARYHKPDVDTDARVMHTAAVRNVAARLWLPAAKRYFAAIAGARKEVLDALHRRGVVAAALPMFKHQPTKAAEFWGGLAADDGLSRTDPRSTLAEHLRRHEDTRVVELDVYAVAQAWNAFYRGRKLKTIRLRESKPFDIAGTPVGDICFQREA